MKFFLLKAVSKSKLNQYLVAAMAPAREQCLTLGGDIVLDSPPPRPMPERKIVSPIHTSIWEPKPTLCALPKRKFDQFR